MDIIALEEQQILNDLKEEKMEQKDGIKYNPLPPPPQDNPYLYKCKVYRS